jgi:hypothetical protein
MKTLSALIAYQVGVTKKSRSLSGQEEVTYSFDPLICLVISGD